MSENKKITDLDPSIPKDGYAFVAATGADNFRVSYSDLAEYSSIGTKSGTFTQSLTISGETVLTGDALDPRFDDLSGQLVATGALLGQSLQALSGALDASGQLLDDKVSSVSGALDASGQLLDDKVSSVSGALDASGQFLEAEIIKINDGLELVSSSSFVFFSDALNNGGATFKVYNPTPVPDVYLSDVVVDFANDMKISIRWDGPPDDYIGTGYINGTQIPISNITELGDKTRRFEGYLDDLDLAGDNRVTGSSNGRTGYLNLFEIGVGILAEDISIAAVNTAIPAPGSNLGTTDLKNGDTVDIEVVYDANNFFHPLQVPASINIYNENLAQQSTHTNLAWHVSPLGAGFSGVTLPVVVSNRDGNLGVCIDSTNNAGVVAAKQCSTEFAGPNRTRPVDNVAPTISFDAVDYPANQGALKSNESAIVNHTINNADTYSYSSNIGELNITNPGAYEQAKSVSRINGEYNVSNNNFNITATKSTNGIIVSSATNVKIANTALQLSIPNLNGNIQSGPTPGAAYNFNLNSDQIFNTVPSLSLDVSQNPISSLVHSSQGTAPTSNSFALTVEDEDEKGTFNWTVSAVNLAGLVTTQVAPSSYNLKGFSLRDTISDPGRNDGLGRGLHPIGTSVFDPSNVTFENLVEPGNGPNGGTPYAYKSFANGTQLNDTMDFVHQFAICDVNANFSDNGNYIYNLDKTRRDANNAPGNPAVAKIEEN